MDRFKLVSRNLVEIITIEELRKLLEEKERPRAYIGYEPSGLFHIGWLIWAMKVRDLVEAGFDMIILEATWHAWINDKLGGDMELIKKDALYVRHVLKALGIDVSRIRFVDAEDMVSDKRYWEILLRVAKNTTLARMKRALTIMGRKAEEAEMDFSKLIYPAMQVTDIFYLDVDVALGGTDQRRAHMLARDVAEKLGYKKPIAIHTPLLTGLQGAGRMDTSRIDEDTFAVELKMSKSRPETTILVHDSPEEIRRKIRKAYCPAKEVRFNPIIEINKYILFTQKDFILHIDRPEKYGGPIDIHSYGELEKMFIEGKIHPLDLKNATAEALVKFLEPVRRYFEENKEAKSLLETLKSSTLTR